MRRAELLCPVLGFHHAAVGEELHVRGGVHGHHVGGQAVVHGARLGAGFQRATGRS